MYSNSILTLLSNCRNLDNPVRSKVLSKKKIVALLKESISPNRELSDFQAEVDRSLQELEVQSEIISGKRELYCIAPPTLFANSKEDVGGLLFRGDRAYLALAHELLKTSQDRDEVKIRPKIRTFDRIKAKLDPAGIRLLTGADLIQRLSSPQQPPKYVLRCPITLPELSDAEELFYYQATPHTAQDKRWQTLSEKSIITDRSLLKLTKDRYFRNDRYFWGEGGELYDLDRDTAILAMFAKDREQDSPLRVSWHTSEGKLDLQDIYLPPVYMRYIWQLSGETERDRVRSIPAVSKPSIESALNKLGCLLA